MGDRVRNVPQANGIILIGADGVTVNWSRRWPVVGVWSVGRDYYDYLKEHDDPALFIGSVSRGRDTGNLRLFFARRVNGPNGMFLGLVLGVVDVNYLIDFYQAAGQHVHEAVTLLRRDGTMLIRYPNPESAIGVKLPPGSPWYLHLAKGGGSYLTPGVLDGYQVSSRCTRCATIRLWSMFWWRNQKFFADWKRQTVCIGCFALAAGLAFMYLFRMLARQFRRQADQNVKLDAVLSNITQGVCFFDGQKRLLLSNRRYAEIYNLPPQAIRIGQSLEAIINYRNAAGSLPDSSLSDYLAWQDQLAAAHRPSNTVVALRNGRFVAIHYQPMPGDGWVATHGTSPRNSRPRRASRSWPSTIH